jgi:hypothetical protein
MLSYASLITVMWVCFVALTTLAEDQTGSSLQAGVGALNRALSNGGLTDASAEPSAETPSRAFASSPRYVVPQTTGIGPETGTEEMEPDSDRIDREAQDYQRFLNELERMSAVEKLPAIEGDVSFDCFEQLPEGRAIPTSLWESADNLRQQFGDTDYEVELTVWAATPSASAWSRAAEQATKLRDAIAQRLQLSDDMLPRFHAVSRPWVYSNLDRPTVSLSVRRIQSK